MGFVKNSTVELNVLDKEHPELPSWLEVTEESDKTKTDNDSVKEPEAQDGN